MDHLDATADATDQAAEEILTFTLSDEALETAADMEPTLGGARVTSIATLEFSDTICC